MLLSTAPTFNQFNLYRCEQTSTENSDYEFFIIEHCKDTKLFGTLFLCGLFFTLI